MKTNDKRKAKPLNVIVLLLIPTLAILWMAGIFDSKHTTPISKPYFSLKEIEQKQYLQNVCDNNRIQWYAENVEQLVKGKLKFPEEADFQSQYENFYVIDAKRREVMIAGDVISKNAYGVKSKLGYSIFFIVGEDDKTITLESVNM